ncbi:TauD/TfdA family dioxygenase [Saccharopolyspora sp. NPDC050389]|uniref:TauD/TfdA family dioxygenase n=1 Tax=Saccharopolyspora sp. NPDC050389 TaxID=3155516 RepID=UPI0033EC1D48
MTTTHREVLRTPYRAAAAWKGHDMSRSAEWICQLDDEQVGELESALQRLRTADVPLLRVTRDDFPLPSLGGVLRELADELENGRGFVLIKGLPVDRYTESEAALIYWGIGQHLGIPVSQNAAGHLLGHVRDTGRTVTDTAVRGYQTNARLPYHTDGSDVVGLLCLRPARSGGLSTIVSSAAIYNEILERRPDLIERLYRPYCFDRREEEQPGEKPYYAVPLAAWHDGKLSMRYIRRYVESAQRFDEVPRLQPEDVELFDLIDELANSDEFRLDMDFEVGDMQFLNNYAMFHSRTGYEDFDEPERKRHLLRLWLTMRDGRRLPSGYLRSMTHQDGDSGRGGISPRDVITG